MSKKLFGRMLVAAATTLASIASVVAWLPTVAHAQTTITNKTSPNWAGYIINYTNPDPNNDPLGASGAWNVPKISCTENGKAISGKVAAWVGLGGVTNGNAFEQLGTTSQCANGKATYYAWYEFPPAAPVKINTTKTQHASCVGKSPIAAGDDMQADVVDQGFGQFALQIWDTTKNWYCPVLWINQSSSAVPQTAEWIVEDPLDKTSQGLKQETWPQFKNGVSFIACTWMQNGATNPLYSGANLTNETIYVYPQTTPNPVYKDNTETMTASVPEAFLVQWLHY